MKDYAIAQRHHALAVIAEAQDRLQDSAVDHGCAVLGIALLMALSFLILAVGA